MTNHILLTNQRPNRPVIDSERMTSATLCGRAASVNDVEFVVASRPVASGAICADCARLYLHPDFARMRAR